MITLAILNPGYADYKAMERLKNAFPYMQFRVIDHVDDLTQWLERWADHRWIAVTESAGIEIADFVHPSSNKVVYLLGSSRAPLPRSVFLKVHGAVAVRDQKLLTPEHVAAIVLHDRAVRS